MPRSVNSPQEEDTFFQACDSLETGRRHCPNERDRNLGCGRYNSFESATLHTARSSFDAPKARKDFQTRFASDST